MGFCIRFLGAMGLFFRVVRLVDRMLVSVIESSISRSNFSSEIHPQSGDTTYNTSVIMEFGWYW